ncbi:MAG: hypothetical protein ACM3NW_10005 [Syntrophomonadaceae bacterium]
MFRTRLAVAVLAASAFAAVALGQNADKNTAGPTKNDYRLKVVEPAEGAAITGPTVRVVVDTTIREQLDGEKVDVNSMPRPVVDVWLDGTRRGTMKDAENVIEIDNVSPGPHKLALVAKNKANEIIDKKEINFNSTASSVATANSSGTTPANPAPVESSASTSTYGSTTPSDSSLAGPTTSSTYSSSASSSTRSSSTYTPPQSTSSTETAMNRPRPRVPETASNDGALALAGGTLLLGAYLLRRHA